ncbi:MAG: CvpA family protein [Firmicutes bacterium]|nr:CvpA family protein [Bacillota bacterium]
MEGVEASGILNGVSFGLLGLFIFTIVMGLVFGLVRGFKRSLFRLGILFGASLIAFFTAPLIARAFTTIAENQFDEHLMDQGNVGAAVNNFSGLTSVFYGIPIAIIALFVFIVLFYLLKWISWIFYAIFAGKVRHRDAKKGRLLGMVVGVVQGFVIFFFVFIPVNGFINTLNRIDNYTPEFATAEVRMFDEDINFMAPVNEFIRDWNADIQGSAYGVISRITGMQALGGPMFGYLTTIRTSNNPNVNLRQDVMRGFEVQADFVAIWQNFFDEEGNRLDTAEVLKELPQSYYNAIGATIRKLFDIEFVRLLANAGEGVAGFLEEIDFFEDFQIFEGDAQDAAEQARIDELNERFNDAIIASFRHMNANFIRNDLVNTVEVLRVLFTQTREFNGNYYNLFEALRSVVDGFNDDGDMDEASSKLAVFLSGNTQETAVYRLLSQVFNMGVFSQILTTSPTQTGTDTFDIVRVPLMLFLDLEEADVDFPFTWNTTAYDLTRMFNSGVAVFTEIADIINSDEDILDLIADLDDSILINIGEVLNILTMEINFSPIVRAVVSNFINDIDFDFELGVEDEIEDLVNEILDRLETGDIDWRAQLVALKDLIIIAQEILNFDGNNLGDILDIIFGDDLFDILKDNDLIGPIVVRQIEEIVNSDNLLGGILGDTISINLDSSRENFAYSLEALRMLGDGMTEIVNALDNDNLDVMDIIEILDSTGETLRYIATMMPDGGGGYTSPISIYIDSDVFDDLAQILGDLDNSMESDIINQIINNIFRPLLP